MLEYQLNSNGDGYVLVDETDKTVTEIIIPDTYEGLPVKEIAAMFVDHINLKTIRVGRNVTATYYGTFDCPSIEKIYFGNSIKSVMGPFNMMTALTDIYYDGTAEEWEKIYFGIIDNLDTTQYIDNARKHFGHYGKSGLLEFEGEKIFPITHWDCVKGKPEGIDSSQILYDGFASGIDAENVKQAIDELNAKHFDASMINSWTGLQRIVRSGKARDYLDIGDQLVSLKNGEELIWQVIAFDEETPVNPESKHSMTLELCNSSFYLPFSSPKATYFTLNGLSAGQYYLKIKKRTSDDVYYSFTLTEDLPETHLIRIFQSKVYLHENRRSDAYKTFDVDFESTNVEEMTGTELQNNIYYVDCMMGTTDYSKSDIRAWLNEDNDDWWHAKDSYSLCSKSFRNAERFKSGMDEDFLSAVNPVIKQAKLADGSNVTVEDDFFLLSRGEIYGRSDEKAYEYYEKNTTLVSPSYSADAARIKLNSEGKVTLWWLRDSADGDKGVMRVVLKGDISSNIGSGEVSSQIIPACCIC